MKYCSAKCISKEKTNTAPSVCAHSDIYEVIWFILSVINNIELYIKSLGGERKPKLVCHLLHKVFSRYARNLVYC